MRMTTTTMVRGEVLYSGGEEKRRQTHCSNNSSIVRICPHLSLMFTTIVMLPLQP